MGESGLGRLTGGTGLTWSPFLQSDSEGGAKASGDSGLEPAAGMKG